MTVEKDLAWLDEATFEFTLSFNDHRCSFETVAQYFADHDIDIWTSDIAKADAVSRDRLIRAHVYPTDANSSFAVAGTEIATVIQLARKLCEDAITRLHAEGRTAAHNRNR